MSNSLVENLDSFINAYIDLAGDDKRQFLTEFDTDWLSPCLLFSEVQLTDVTNGEQMAWRPQLQPASSHLGDLAAALEIDIHPQ